MIIKIRIGSWRFTFTIAPITDVIGVNSQLNNGKHIIMWDFDNEELYAVEATLKIVQVMHGLPNIYILTTGKPKHYIAYCFESCTWRQSIEIVAATHFVDPNFFKYGVYREHWTLRVSPKEGRKPKLVYTLHSPKPETANISQLNSWVKDARKPSKPTSQGSAKTTLDGKLFSFLSSLRLETSAQNMKHWLMQL